MLKPHSWAGFTWWILAAVLVASGTVSIWIIILIYLSDVVTVEIAYKAVRNHLRKGER